MKKIGFIDYFLDEWHAEKYPNWIKEATGGGMQVAYAYGKIDSPSGKTNAEWCAAHGVELLDSIEAVVERSDYLVVLSPDHPEYHEELCQLPLRSGKPTYVDKTFAPDRETAIRLFELAARHGTPICSTSALRYAAEYAEAAALEVATLHSVGPGRFENYAIHQIEPLIALMGGSPDRVMSIGTSEAPALLIGFADGRQAAIHHFGWECPFAMTLNDREGHAHTLKVDSDFFAVFIRQMAAFFETAEPLVAPAETIAIVSVIEYGLRAMQTPHEWVAIPTTA
ncbi:hypothetical protein [Cohnella nanjingensis]|uniref:Gfo/Idh/MocA family oxidoreductase n=1 Tax=Cohnella nanjingensis TaxID=1387779 RepID=A0A7X0VIE1_9BACL|nr:hypothetical protein [Cohnella nanjingensis]MBB6675097.1 hypothetical protein [Cohnella nanjingensis]